MSSPPLVGLALRCLFQTGTKQAEKLPYKGGNQGAAHYFRPTAQKAKLYHSSH